MKIPIRALVALVSLASLCEPSQSAPPVQARSAKKRVDLQLSTVQRAKLRAIARAHRAQLKALWGDKAETMAQKKPKLRIMKAMAEATRRKSEAVLTLQQRKIWEAQSKELTLSSSRKISARQKPRNSSMRKAS